MVEDVLAAVGPQTKATVHQKAFSVAGTFFDYVFHPIFNQETRDALRAVDFQKFIAAMIWMHNQQESEDLLRQFIKLMAGKRPDNLFFLQGKVRTSSPVVRLILEFAAAHQTKILHEMAAERASRYNWVEPSLSSLIFLLSRWSDELGALEVICDESRPLKEAEIKFSNFFYAMTDEERRRSGMYKSIGFNLKGPIAFADSKESAGVQVADIFASALTYAFKHEAVKHWENIVRDSVVNFVYPDVLIFDPEKPKRLSMEIILHEMVKRSLSGGDMNDGMPEVIRGAMLAPFIQTR